MEFLAAKPGRPDHNRNPDLHKGDNKDKFGNITSMTPKMAKVMGKTASGFQQISSP